MCNGYGGLYKEQLLRNSLNNLSNMRHVPGELALKPRHIKLHTSHPQRVKEQFPQRMHLS